MKKILILFCSILLFTNCSSSEELSSSSSDDLLTRHPWVNSNSEIVEITNHGSLSYNESKSKIENRLKNRDELKTVLSFKRDGSGKILYPESNTLDDSKFGWLTVPPNKLRLIMSTSAQTLLFEYTVDNSRLSLTFDEEYQYNGTLIKYIVKWNFNKQ